MLKRLSLAALAAAAIGLPPVAALADAPRGPTGREFGQHVAQCAHLMGGFTGAHNPGMHRGFAGWDGMTCTA
ncbi:MAG TPA: hypothetical protein VLW53_17990 [Candidatus Eisenbacteria bacterium]|nr:hypothetical protein [Candidatus Eisenbacteria bacterium]